VTLSYFQMRRHNCQRLCCHIRQRKDDKTRRAI